MPVKNYNTTTEYQGENFKDLLAPLADYTKWFNTIEDSYNVLGSNSENIGQYVKDEPTSQSAQLYNEYTKDLANAVDLLYQGTNPSTMRNLMRLKKDFNSKIVPIGNAANAKMEAIKSYNTERMKNKDLFGDDPREHSVDEWLFGRDPKLTNYNGNDIYTYAKDMAKGISERIWSDDQLNKAWGDIWRVIQYQGIATAPEGIMEMYLRSKDGTGKKYRELEDVVDGILMTQELDPNDTTNQNVLKAIQYATNGMAAGLIYKRASQPMTNPYIKGSGRRKRTTRKPPETRKSTTRVTVTSEESRKAIREHEQQIIKSLSGRLDLDKPEDLEVYNNYTKTIREIYPERNYSDADLLYLLNQSDGSNLTQERRVELDAQRDDILHDVATLLTPDIKTKFVEMDNFTDKAKAQGANTIRTRLSAVGVEERLIFSNRVPAVTNYKGEAVKQSELEDLLDKENELSFGLDSRGFFIKKSNVVGEKGNYYIDPILITEDMMIQENIKTYLRLSAMPMTPALYGTMKRLAVAIFDAIYTEWNTKVRGESETTSSPVGEVTNNTSEDDDNDDDDSEIYE